MNASAVPMTDDEQDGPAPGWMGHPRHLRRVYDAAARAAGADRDGVLDDWIMHWLKRTRNEALAEHTQDEIDDWTMDGLQTGRTEN